MKSFGKSDIGQVRSLNQDAFLIEKRSSFQLLCVCDGMGGARAGEVASSIAIASMRASFLKALPEKKDSKSLSIWLEVAMQRANQDVFKQAQHPNYSGMGTTMVAILISDEAMIGMNVGDSRLYVLNNMDQLTQVSVDHSLVQEMMNKGQISLEQAKHHPQRAVLTQVLGVQERVNLDLFVLELSIQGLLICSDGLHNMVDESLLESIILKKLPLKDRVNHMIDEANHAGGLDNITLILAMRESK